MLKYKDSSTYKDVSISISRIVCPVHVDTSNNGCFMKVLNGAWTLSKLFAIWITNNIMNCDATSSMVSENKLSFPSEANITVSGNILIRS